MLEMFFYCVMILGAVTAIVVVSLLCTFVLYCMCAEGIELFQDYWKYRKTNKFFNDIEEFRNDFA